MKFKDIRIFFNIKSQCCNQLQDPLHGWKTLVEPMQNPESYFENLARYKHLDLYEFCVTYDPNRKMKKNRRTYYLDNNIHRETDLRESITKYISTKSFGEGKKISNYILLMFPEFNNMGVLHWHGMMYFNNANYYYCNKVISYFNKKYGRTRGKKVYNFDNYKSYMLKDTKHPTIHRPIYLTDMITEGGETVED